MSDVEQRNAPSLSPELWAEVFAHLELRPDNIDIWDKEEHFKHQLNQKEVHRVKLVCKHFKELHASQSSLVQRLYIGQAFVVSSLPSLLMWLHQSKSTLQIFKSTNATVLVDIVLSGLVSSDSSIKLVDVYNVSATSIPMIATFTSLGKCALMHERGEHLDLSPLRGLPKLVHLGLQGNFKELHHLTGLTRLEISRSTLSIQEFATTLQHLHIVQSTLLDVPAQGVLACFALTQLVSLDSYVEGNNGERCLAIDMCVVRTSFRLLTQLHLTQLQTLQLSTCKTTSHFADLKWVKPHIPSRVEHLFPSKPW